MRQEKLMIMQLQLDMRESSGKRPTKKIKRSMRLLCKDMVILYKGLPHPKGKISILAPKAKHEYPCMVKLYHSHHVTSKSNKKVM